MLALSIPEFELPSQCGIVDTEVYRKGVEFFEAIGRGSVHRSDWLQRRTGQLKELPSDRSLQSELSSVRDAQAVLHLWATDDEWRHRFPPDNDGLSVVLRRFRKLRPSLLMQLSDLYLRHFDRLPCRDLLERLLLKLYEKTDKRRLFREYRAIQTRRAIICSDVGPAKLAQAALQEKGGFSTLIDSFGLGRGRAGRYLELARFHYYIEAVRQLSPGQVSHVFDEVQRPNVREASFDANAKLGQKIAHELIAKCVSSAVKMPENWVDLLLKLVGDPRRPTSSMAYQKWWATMPAGDEDAVRAWLAQADLRLFLKLLKDSSTDADLDRMFPAREKFLRGLLDHYDIVDARLFLSRNARNSVRAEFGSDALSAHGQVEDLNKTIIYINIADRLHFFEGTHNYKARGGGVLPSDSRILARQVPRFSYRELSTGLEQDLRAAGENALKPTMIFGVAHHPPLTWQRTLIGHMQSYGVDIDPEHALTSSDYLKYRKKFGI
ncbi:MAG: EH signature domain-containing protein [Pseudomonadota bacterium]